VLATARVLTRSAVAADMGLTEHSAAASKSRMDPGIHPG